MIFIKANNCWWELQGDKAYDIVGNGGYHLARYYLENDLVEDKVEVDKWSDLDWNGTVNLDDKYVTGWINKEGVHFGCDSECHSNQAELVHKEAEYELENKGWIKIYKPQFSKPCKNGYNFFILSTFHIHNRINRKQREKLLELGFTMKEIEESE